MKEIKAQELTQVKGGAVYVAPGVSVTRNHHHKPGEFDVLLFGKKIHAGEEF